MNKGVSTSRFAGRPDKKPRKTSGSPFNSGTSNGLVSPKSTHRIV